MSRMCMIRITDWLYMVGRVKPGASLPALQEKVSALVRQSVAPNEEFADAENKAAAARRRMWC